MNNTKTLNVLNYLAIAFMMTASAAGIFDPAAYARESATWGAQGFGQDIINLFLIAPAMLASFHLAKKGNKPAYIIWLGLIIYTAYSYLLYAFAMHFNRYFLVYCAALGTSIFAFLLAFKDTDYEGYKLSYGGAEFRFIPGALIVTAIIFTALWLMEVIPSTIANSTPKSVMDAGLMINPVHVNDLSLLLPAFIAAGVLLIRKKAEGYVFVPAMFSFSVAMDAAIIAMTASMNIRGIESGNTVLYIMGFFAAVSAVMMIVMLRKIKNNGGIK